MKWEIKYANKSNLLHMKNDKLLSMLLAECLVPQLVFQGKQMGATFKMIYS